MGVLNVTPDSFSDAGMYLDPADAIRRGMELIQQGADWLDVGGESTRPGSNPVEPAEQARRTVPVIQALAKTGTVISIDTTSSDVAAAALDAGACVINDISAATDDQGMPGVMRQARAVVLMHKRGSPRTMQQDTRYDDVVAEVEAYLLTRAAAVAEAGVDRRRILLDPGIGFGKNLLQNLLLLRALPRLADHGYPILVGPSRKRFIGTLSGEPRPDRRQFGTAAAVAWSVANGAAVLRVHDVAEMRQVLRVTAALADLRRDAEEES
jgi:dihydropteroate synthase